MAELRHDKWTGTTYGNNWMHKWLIRMLKVIDVRFLYAFTFVFIVPPTIIINRKATKAIYNFYREGFNYGKIRTCWMVYKNHCAFAQVVIDKFAMYAGKKFNISLSGFEHYIKLIKGEKGFIQLSSHIGNYELAGYSLIAKEKRFNALVFGGEKESVMKNRSRLFTENNIRMIPMESDMTYLFMIDSILNNGEILSMPADRVFGSQKSFSIDFLGHTGHFPQGPFVLASMKEVPVLFVAVMKTASKNYIIEIKQLQTPKGINNRDKAKNLALQYVNLLETTVKKYPAQWYNYFNIWS